MAEQAFRRSFCFHKTAFVCRRHRMCCPAVHHNKSSPMFVQLCQPLFPFSSQASSGSGIQWEGTSSLRPPLLPPLAPHADDAFVFQATKIHQRTFGNDHPITARSLELMATVYAEIGKTEYSGRVPPGAAGIRPCWENNRVGAGDTSGAPLSPYQSTL